MQPRIETKIWLALQARAKVAAESVGLPVSWPNKVLQSPPSSGYLRVRHVPNSPGRFLLGDEAPSERLGILQLMLMSPQDEDVAVALDLAARLAEQFSTGTRLRYDGVTVSIRSAPEVGQVVPTGSYAEVAVNIQYRCFA